MFYPTWGKLIGTNTAICQIKSGASKMQSCLPNFSQSFLVTKRFMLFICLGCISLNKIWNFLGRGYFQCGLSDKTPECTRWDSTLISYLLSGNSQAVFCGCYFGFSYTLA